jgi:hypothetical protein
MFKTEPKLNGNLSLYLYWAIPLIPNVKLYLTNGNCSTHIGGGLHKDFNGKLATL